MEPTKKEIEEKREEAAQASARRTRFPGMSYAEGVRDALAWVLGELEDELDV